MEDKFKEICERLNLTSIGINYWYRWSGEPYFTIYAHYDDRGCVSGSGPDIASALKAAEEEMKAVRL